jgi:hypothetical protein
LTIITQRPTNISIKIDTTKEFAGDEMRDYHDLEKSEVGAFRATVCGCSGDFDAPLSTDRELLGSGL